jgi:hypothetical protein
MEEISSTEYEMIICREELVTLETLAKQQTRIFNDAEDFGIEVNDRNASKVKEVHEALEELHKALGWEVKSNGDLKSGTWEAKVFIPIEYDGPVIAGTYVRVKYVTTHWAKYLSIEISSGNQVRR